MAEDGLSLRGVLDKRSDVLRYLRETSARKPELVDELPISRSTVDRAIQDLIEGDCVTETEGRYTATKTGRLAFTEYDGYVSTTDSIQQSAQLLNHLPESSNVDPVLLEGASVTLAKPHAPDHALVPTEQLVENATIMKGLAPVVHRSYLTTLSAQLKGGSFDAEIIAEPDVISALSDFSSGLVDPFVHHESLSLYRTEEQLPFALWLMETPTGTHAGITVYDSGGIAGTIVNDSAGAVAWAREIYQGYREQAQRVTASEN